MTRPRALAALTVVAVVSVVLPSAPVAAAPVFVDATTYLVPRGFSSTSDISGTGCTSSAPVLGPGDAVQRPLGENGPAVTATGSVSASFSDTDVPGDTATGSATATATATITSAGGTLGTIDLVGTGSGQLNNPGFVTSQCRRSVSAGVGIGYEFVLPGPGFLHLDMTSRGGMDPYFTFYGRSGDPSNPSIDGGPSGLATNFTTTAFLLPGRYDGEMVMQVDLEGPSATLTAASGRIHVRFVPAGSQTVAVTGKGRKYVVPAGTRSCATHELAASVTAKKRRAAAIRKVTFLVDDRVVKKVKRPKKGATVSLPVPDDVAAEVVAKVQLAPRTKGAKPRTHEVSASYEACTG